MFLRSSIGVPSRSSRNLIANPKTREIQLIVSRASGEVYVVAEAVLASAFEQDR